MAEPVITEIWRSLEPVTRDPFIDEFRSLAMPDAPVSPTGGAHELPTTAAAPRKQLASDLSARGV